MCTQALLDPGARCHFTSILLIPTHQLTSNFLTTSTPLSSRSPSQHLPLYGYPESLSYPYLPVVVHHERATALGCLGHRHPLLLLSCFGTHCPVASAVLRRTSERLVSANPPLASCRLFLPLMSRTTHLGLRALAHSLVTVLIPFFMLVVAPTLVSSFDFPDTMHACTVLEPPYVIQASPDSPLTGISITYLEQLQSVLSFNVTHHVWPSWSSLINVLSNCTFPVDPSFINLSLPNPTNVCPCHIGVGSFTRTNDRVERVKFVWPHGNEALQMVSRKSDLRVESASSAWFLFSTFSTSVWILIAVGILLHACGTIFFGPFLLSPDAHPPTGTSLLSTLWHYISRFPAAVLVSYAHLLGQPFHEQQHSKPSFHRTAWLLLGLTTGVFLLTIYASSLTVMLFEGTKPSPFRTIDDVTDCNIDQSKFTMIGGGSSHAFWMRHVNNSLNRERCQWTQPGRTVVDLEEGFSVVMNESSNVDYFFTLQGSVLYNTNRRCNDISPVGEPFVFTSVGFILPTETNESLRQVLDRETRLLRERDAFPSAMLVASRDSCDDTQDATVTVGQLRVFFILYIAAWTILVVFRAVFLCLRRRHPEPRQTY